jgi:hypothetical protein
MDEPIDPALEASLRRVLRQEAARLPFTLVADEIHAVRLGRTTRARRSLALVAAAAVIVVGVGVAALTIRPPGPASTPEAPADQALASLPSFERLLGAAQPATEIGRGEGSPSEAAGEVPVAELPAGERAQVVAACTGPDLDLAVVHGARRTDLLPIACTGGVSSGPVPGAALPDTGSATLVVDPAPATAWRVVVVGDATSALASAGQDAVPGLPGFDQLLEQARVGAVEVARGSGTATDATVGYRIPGLAEPAGLQIVFACSGGPLGLAWATGPDAGDELGAPDVFCSGEPLVVSWQRDPSTAGVSELHVLAPQGTAWVAVVLALPGPDPSASAP